MPRFFVNQSDVYSDAINITGEDVNHIKRVLRLKCGDNIVLNAGNGIDYTVEIEKFEQDYIRTLIISSNKNGTEPPIEITLFQGLPKSDKMDFIIQKSVELGVKKVVPVITTRTVAKIDNPKDAEKKVTRWQRISLEAAKQCNRGIVPQIGFPLTLEQALSSTKGEDLSIILYEKEIENSLRKYIDKNQHIKRIAMFIGPEGGFEETEIAKAVSYGVNPVTLGPRILRTETAGITVLSILMYQLGDVG